MPYDFDAQNQIEDRYVPLLKRYLREKFHQEPEDVRNQRLEYDFRIGNLQLDLKVDTRLESTANFFIETESVKILKKGWLYNENTDYILYLDPSNMFLYWIDLKRLRRYETEIKRWPFKNILNKGWITSGHTVPISAMSRFPGVIKQVYLAPFSETEVKQ